MRAPIRAKYRVLNIAQDYDGKWTVSLRPIQRGRGKDPENKLFWDATPSGEATLQFSEKPELRVGNYYYMDLEPDDEGETKLNNIEFQLGGGISVWYSRSHSVSHPVWPENDGRLWMQDSLKMSLSGGDDLVRRNNFKDGFGMPDDGPWTLAVSWAEDSD